MDTDDKLTSEKEPTGKSMAQRLAKRRRDKEQPRAKTEPTPEVDKDEDSNDEDEESRTAHWLNNLKKHRQTRGKINSPLL